MTKLACVLMGLAFILMGFLGLTGITPMFQIDPYYVNIAEILLGALGLIVGIYSRKNTKREQEAKDLSKQTKDNTARQMQENDRLKKENDQSRRADADRQKQQNDQLTKQNERQKQENEKQKQLYDQQRQENADQKKENEQLRKTKRREGARIADGI